MLSSEARARFCVVLVGARNPQNIGAAARAMQDFGYSDLRVVNEFSPPFEAAQLQARSAVGASAIMERAQLFTSLADAIGDCHLVAGTTAVGERELRLPLHTLQSAASSLRASLQSRVSEGPPGEPERKVALLFGSEKTGLTNEQLSFCDLLLTIPLFAPEAGRHLSMNLGQAVAVCLYELGREGFEGSRDLPEASSRPPTAADRERLLTIFSLLLSRAGYTQRFPANSRPEVLRALVKQLGSTREETSTWMGILRMLGRPFETNGEGHEES